MMHVLLVFLVCAVGSCEEQQVSDGAEETASSGREESHESQSRQPGQRGETIVSGSTHKLDIKKICPSIALF